MKLVPVILSGGAGTRLWPISRQTHPKPFMSLPDGENLLRKTFKRAAAFDDVSEILTVTNTELHFKTKDEYKSIGINKIQQSFILEPFGRNTAAAVAAAAITLQKSHGDEALILVLASDHLIQDESAFNHAVNTAKELAKDGLLVTFGIKPTVPETGFGYIEADQSCAIGGGFRVSRFVEKPNLELANEFVQAGNYLWNSGMFCMKIGTLLEEMTKYCPKVINSVKNTIDASTLRHEEKNSVLTLDAEAFAEAPDISIDYAVMEHSTQVATVPCSIGWSDIGSWSAMSELIASDSNDNRFEGEVLCWDASHNFVHSQSRLTSLIGVENLIVVDTPDALLITDKNHAQDVKHIVGQLKSSGHEAHLNHRTVHRPWGAYTTLEQRERFKIKSIVVKPGESLSLQMHHHRSEHWIVVKGMARVVNDDQELLLNTNESTFIRAGHKHRLENPGVIDLVLIEVQCGDYLGEDDIVRFADIYGRVPS